MRPGYKTIGLVAMFAFGGAAHFQSIGASGLRAGFLVVGLVCSTMAFWSLVYGKYAESGRVATSLHKLGFSGQRKDFWGRYKAMPVRLQETQVDRLGVFAYVHHFSAEMENPARRAISWPEIYKALPYALEQELDALIEPWQSRGVSLHLIASASILKVTFKIHFGFSDLIGSEDFKQLERTFELLTKVHARLRSMLLPSTAAPTFRPDHPNPTFF